MGGPFLGTCFQCGRTNLPSSAALEYCSNERGLSKDDALLETLK
jgi:hypothetical protein